jgi:hypothetical protein
MFLIQGNFGNKGNFEAVVREGNKLVHYWRNNDDTILPWYKSVVVANNVASAPAMTQGNFGNMGNFELVVREGNKLRLYWRNNDAAGVPWTKGVLFGDNVDSAPAMIQSNFGNMGNFELVVREGNKLRHYWRNNDAAGVPWTKGVLFGDNVNSAPSMIQSNFGNTGNFELVVREGNKLRLYWRNNGVAGFPWTKGVLFGDNVNSAPAMIQSNFGNMGNFELVVREGDKLRHYWRNNDAAGVPWNVGVLFGDHITSVLSFIQGGFGNIGNFELLAKRGNCLTHFWRNNDAAGLPWSEEIQTHAVVPLGQPPSGSQESQFLGYFPNLRNWNVTAPATGAYNCIAWSVGITNQWLWPGSTVANFDAFYASYGWTPSASGKREYGKRKVALWAINSVCKHGSRETYDCDWHESKCGGLERIMHDKFQMQGGTYGKIIKYYEKQDPNANLDLL